MTIDNTPVEDREMRSNFFSLTRFSALAIWSHKLMWQLVRFPSDVSGDMVLESSKGEHQVYLSRLAVGTK